MRWKTSWGLKQLPELFPDSAVIPWGAAHAIRRCTVDSESQAREGPDFGLAAALVCLEEGKGQESSGPYEVQSTFEWVTDAQPEQGSEAAARSPYEVSLLISSVVSLNGRRAPGVERRNGWLSGKSSEGPKPMDGSGAKQSHKVSRGLSR